MLRAQPSDGAPSANEGLKKAANLQKAAKAFAKPKNELTERKAAQCFVLYGFVWFSTSSKGEYVIVSIFLSAFTA